MALYHNKGDYINMVCNKERNKRISLDKIIWCKIRYYQQLYEVSDDDLAARLGVCARTLFNYDKDAKNLTIGNIDNFLNLTSMTLQELMNL